MDVLLRSHFLISILRHQVFMGTVSSSTMLKEASRLTLQGTHFLDRGQPGTCVQAHRHKFRTGGLEIEFQ